MWTPEQQTAIDARNVSLIVSAAAGSGKTSVLVERLTKILADDVNKIPANEMIIVTFTNAATAEMKYRLSDSLSRMSAEHPENEWIASQLSLLPCAKISTINSFCFELIRENIQDTEVASGFRIIDEAENKIIIHNCISDTLEYAYANFRPVEMEMLYNYFCEKDDKKIEDILLKLYEFMESVPYNDRWLNNLYINLKNDEYINNLRMEFMGIVTEELYSAVRNAELAKQIVTDEGDDSKDAVKVIDFFTDETDEISMKCCKLIDILKDRTEKIKNNINDKSEKINPAEFTFEFKRKASLKKSYSEETDIFVSELRDEYKDSFNKISTYISLINRFDYDILSHRKIFRMLIKLMEILNRKISEVKSAKNGLSFSDAEKIALSLLSTVDDNGIIHKSKLAEELSEYYKIIMIDEYQDSNDNQDIIFKLLSKGGDAYKNGSNMFMVGDVKQAIYGFRQSNAGLFIDTMNNFSEYHEGTSENSYINLNMNFRSSQAVIDFVNYVFSHIMNSEIGDIEYNNDSEKLKKGAVFADNDKSTEIAFIHESDDSENASAEWTAQKILEMVNSQHPVTLRTKDENGNNIITTRPCEYSDFCLLFRTNASAAIYSEILKNYGIPVFSEETDGYLTSREISLMINILRVINNPLLDVPLLSIMVSPMFFFTADEVTEIRLCNADSNLYVALCNAAGQYDSEENDNKTEPMVSGALYNKCVNFLNIISELRVYSATDTLEQLIRRIYERTDFLSVMQVYSDSERKKANLRILIEYAKSYENGSFGGLSGFLRYIDRSIDIKSQSFRHGSTSAGTENAVSLKTMHKSKGLEFPFVFVCETEKHFNINPADESQMKLDRKYGMAFRLQNVKKLYKYKTAIYEVIHEKKIKELLSEEMRLMYVTLTRAKEKIFIPLKINDNLQKKITSFALKIDMEQGITTSLLRQAKSMRDWLIISLIASKYSADVVKYGNAVSTFSYNDDFDIKFTEVKTESENQENKETDDKNTDYVPNEETVLKLENSFRFFESVYDFGYSELPAKLSVSDVSKEHSVFDAPLKRPEFITEKEKLTGAESGTALHTFMQYCDFERIAEYTEDELNQCVKKGFITQKQHDSINPRKIKNFTKSELFKRIMNSEKYMREQKFMINLQDIDASDIISEKYAGKNIILQGIADILFIENGKAVLVDYKTDYAKTEEHLINLYSCQLLLYKLAFEKILGIPVSECIIYSFSLDKSIKLV